MDVTMTRDNPFNMRERRRRGYGLGDRPVFGLGRIDISLIIGRTSQPTLPWQFFFSTSSNTKYTVFLK